ncbi:unnamed protein product [Arctogadus glacialis]
MIRIQKNVKSNKGMIPVFRLLSGVLLRPCLSLVLLVASSMLPLSPAAIPDPNGPYWEASLGVGIKQ